MTAFEELQRRQDRAIAFCKNRLDLTLAHQKEMTALFFKVTIGYFAILYGVFLIYKILYDVHFKDVDFFLYLILFFFSSTFFYWGLPTLNALRHLDGRIKGDQESLDKELHKSRQIIPIPPDWTQLQTSSKDEEEYQEEQRRIKDDDALREITFEHNSQSLLLMLGVHILIVPLVLLFYTLSKILQTHTDWRGGFLILVVCLGTLSLILGCMGTIKYYRTQKKLTDLFNKDRLESN